MEEYQDLMMKIYWDCQELITSLSDKENAVSCKRKQVILSWVEKIDNKYPRLPEFKSEYDWLNVAQPVTMERLNGLVTLFDFFTYCCINCMHILPDLERLEKKYEGSKLSVIGIHSAKFENEKVGDHLSDAIARYDIRHPVCNDTSAWLWSTLGVTCWPTQLLLGPHGKPLWVSMGEGQADWIDEIVGAMLEYYGGKGLLTGEPVIAEIASKVEGRILSYPGKVAVRGDKILVSDTGNNRILVMDKEGNIQDIVGGPEAGDIDGSFSQARFRHPQGVERVGNLVYVCDTENNLIKCLDMETKMVSTVARAPGLSSPWDIVHLKLEEKGEFLIVAMAGCHQLWMYCITDVSWWKGAKYPAGGLVCIVGSGKEENRNTSYPLKVGLAQPSGLSTDGRDWIFFADSESSSVRKVSLKDGAVTNVAGGERDPTNLFSYGDIDGESINAKLQHPLGVTLDTSSNILYIADSYNHKLKKAEQKGKLWNVTSVVGDLSEPGGICFDPDSSSIYIADTNNHCIKKFDIKTNATETVDVKNNIDDVDSPEKLKDEASENFVLSNKENQIILKAGLGLNPGLHLNAEAPSSWKIVLEESTLNGRVTEDGLDVSFPRVGAGDLLQLQIVCRLYLCSDQGICSVKNVKRILRITFADSANDCVLNIGNL